MQWLDDLRDDVKFAIRQLQSAPGFASVVVLTLALGIGANSAIFALVDATLLRPLPLSDPDRLVMMWERTDTSRHGVVSPLNMLDWHERSGSFDAVAGFVPSVGGMVMNGAGGMAETVPRQWVTAGIFDVLQIQPIVGRTFLPSDENARANVVVLSEAFWRMRYRGDPSIVGRDVRLDGAPFTVVGIVPDESRLLGDSGMWALMPLSRDPRARAARFLHVIGRLKPGVTIDAARADVTTVAAGLAQEFPAINGRRGVTIEPLHDAMMGGDLRLTSILFVGVVGFVLLICCANIANLLLARATVRTRELAIRSALGAGRLRVVRQLLTESLLLATVGGALGVAVGAAIVRVAPTVIPEGLLPGAVTLTFDLRVVAFCAAAALGAGLLFGLAPAWQATQLSSTQVMSSESRSATGRGGRLRRWLVVGEIATAALLLFGAGLLLQTLRAVDNVDRGYRAQGVLSMIVDPLGSSYPTHTSLLQFYEAVAHEVRALPGVAGVAWASTLPMGASFAGESAFEIIGDPPVDDSQRPTADLQIVSRTYFDTVDLPLVAGREFTEHDNRESVAVCLVNEAFVRAHLQGRSPIGVRIATRPPASAQTPPVVREIVGVVKQVKSRPDETEDLLQIYVPITQIIMDDMFMVVRPRSGNASALAPSVRQAIARIDQAQLVSVRDVMTLEDVRSAATARHRFRAVLVTTFAGLALLLAMVGVFGVLAYSVQQRMREFGLRMALGAGATSVLRLVVGNAVRLIATGVVIGLVLATLTSRLLASILSGVEPLDPTTFVAVTIVLAVTAVAATAGPAWRAIRVDPAVALRAE